MIFTMFPAVFVKAAAACRAVAWQRRTAIGVQKSQRSVLSRYHMES